MIKYVKKTVFNMKSDALVNTINCDGVMGAGLALEFSLRYPNMFKQYEKDCKNGKVKVGEIITYKDSGDLIINFPTKDHWKYPSRVSWISSGLDYFVNHYKEWGIASVSIPPLGCNYGGLDFEKEVKPLMDNKLAKLDIEVYICLDPGIAEGKEKEMLDLFNDSNLDFICKNLKIRGKAYKGLMNHEQINRFYEIKKIDGVGLTTYKKLFSYFYDYKDSHYTQPSLF